MKLRELHIQNFRGIRDLRLDLSDTTVLVGENNSGKTAVLAAIGLALDKVRSRRAMAFDAYDFHLPDGASEPSSAQPIQISLVFREDKPDEWTPKIVRAMREVIQNREDQRREIRLRVTAHFDTSTRDFTQDLGFLDLQDQDLPAGERELTRFRELAPFFYLSALRDASRHFDPRGPYWRHFLKDGQLDDGQRADIEEKLKELNDLVVGAHTTFEQVRTAITEVQKVVPIAGGDVVSIDAVPSRIFDMLSRAQVNLAAPTGARIPVHRHGEGTQSLSVLMLFRAFLMASAGDTSPIIALEEPEAHLHPSAVRALWKLLEGLPGQKIISTHSGELLSEVPTSGIRRLHRSQNEIQRYALAANTLTKSETHKLDFHVRYHRGELFFARCWLLVEGETEVLLLTSVARHLGEDFEQLGIRCVPYRQADIALFLKVANDLGIRWCVLADNDSQGGKDHAKIREHLHGANEDDVLVVMPERDIEEHLCVHGFGPVYERCLTDQSRQNVTAIPGDVDYWPQVLKAIKSVRKFSKPAAALDVLERIQAGDTPPPILVQCVKAAATLARD